MFSYLRYFSIISFIVVVLAAGLLGVYFRSIASGDLADVAEKSSISLAQGFINTTWKKHLPNIRRLSQLSTSEWSRYREFVAFSEDTFRHFEGVPVTQLNIYTADGEKVLSIAQDADIQFVSEGNIAALDEDNETRIGFNTAKRGEPYSRIVEDSTFKSPSGKEVQGAVVQTFVPILPDSYSPILAGANVKIDGVIEVFYDITPQWQQLYLFQMVGTGGILVIFITLIGALWFTSKKAETIITTQHEANVELAATAAKAEAESRQKSQFLANVSHELRTPLNAIIGFSEIIKNEVMGALGNETYMNYIKDIHSSGVHLLSLINDILDFSKAEAGKLELQLSEMDATKLIKNCMRLVSPRAEQAKVSLTTEVPNEHFIITGDAKKLKQVLLNLLSNAVKFTPEGGEVKVTAWQNIMDDSISIEVKDSGIGIAPKDISRAMSPFGQVDSALSRKYEGTGLGLPLTKKFVEIMGGTFRIESELNVGTTITITIPLTPPHHVLRASEVRKEEAEEHDVPREKQISPQLAAHAQQAEQDAARTMPEETAFGAGYTTPHTESEAVKPQLLRSNAPVAAGGAAMPSASHAASNTAMANDEAQPPTQMPSLLSGAAFGQPAPVDAPPIDQHPGETYVPPAPIAPPATQDAFSSTPSDTSTTDGNPSPFIATAHTTGEILPGPTSTPAAVGTPQMPEQTPLAQHPPAHNAALEQPSIFGQSTTPPPIQANPAPATPLVPPVAETVPPPAPTAIGAGHKFTSYAEMKKMMQQKQGGGEGER